MTHTLSDGECSVCHATGWRTKWPCPWAFTVPIPKPVRDDAFAKAERYADEHPYTPVLGRSLR